MSEDEVEWKSNRRDEKPGKALSGLVRAQAPLQNSADNSLDHDMTYTSDEM
jgi:hypothetical protein